jgi:hypothetical protein
MFGVILCIIVGVLVFALGFWSARRANYMPVLYLVMAGFFLRLVLQAFVRDLPVFSHGAGGDCQIYETWSEVIMEIWRQNGITFIEQDRFPEMGGTSLPPNLFAMVAYLNAGTSRVGCTSLVALCVALTFVNMFELSRELGAETKSAFWMAAIFTWEPAYLMYTSDMYKDGIVIALTVGALGSAIRLGRKFSLGHLLIGLACVMSLTYVRHYLIFVTVAPLMVGLVGVRSRSRVRTAVMLTLQVAAAVAVANFTNFAKDTAANAQATFQFATGDGVAANSTEGGSGVVFAGDSPFSSFGLKLIYTLFSPFPWEAGSIGFHVGKLDALVVLFFGYRAIRAARRIEFATLLTVLAFLVPCTVMYATTMANVGLIVRQRLVIVAGLALLASLYKPGQKVTEADVEDIADDDELADQHDDAPGATVSARAATP